MEKNKKVVLKTIRCPCCHKIVGEVHGDYRLWCHRCKLWIIGDTMSQEKPLILKKSETK